VGVVLSLDKGNRQVGLVKYQVVGPLGFPTSYEFAPNNNAAVGKGIFTPPPILGPATHFNSWRNEPITNIRFRQCLLVQELAPLCFMDSPLLLDECSEHPSYDDFQYASDPEQTWESAAERAKLTLFRLVQLKPC
jgi:hypothetical protein